MGPSRAMWLEWLNIAHVRQSRPKSGLGFQVKGVQTFEVGPFSRDSGTLGLEWLDVAHIRQPRPYSGLGFQVKIFDRLRVGRGTVRAEYDQGTPTQSHISPSVL